VSRSIPSASTSVAGVMGASASTGKDGADGGAVGVIGSCSEMEVGAVGEEISTSTIDGAEKYLFTSTSSSSSNVAFMDEFNLSHDAINLLGEDGGGRRIDNAGHGGDAPW
jgi:hypothetical protein